MKCMRAEGINRSSYVENSIHHHPPVWRVLTNHFLQNQGDDPILVLEPKHTVKTRAHNLMKELFSLNTPFQGTSTCM